MKIITLVYMLYNPTDNELNRLSMLIKSERDEKIKILVLSDNPNLNENFLDSLPDQKEYQYTFVSCKNNKRKNRQLFDNFNKIKSKFFKICDPDDFIDMKKLNSQLDEINSHNANALILHKQNSIKQIGKLRFKYKHHKERSHNSNSIYPTKLFVKYPNHRDFLLWSDDFLGFWSIVNGAEIVKSSADFYINVRHNGVSTTKKHHEDDSFFLDTMTFLKESEKIIRNDNKNLYAFKKITGKPNKWFFKEVIRDLNLNITLTKEERIQRYRNILLESTVFFLEPKEYNVYTKMIKKII